MGFTESSWDNDSGEVSQPESVAKDWAKLTEKERAAAVDLGYTALSWERTPGWKGPWPSHAHSWSKLTFAHRNALIVLGYNKTSYDDFTAPQPPADTKLWAQLTAKEFKAAKSLGYNALMWDSAMPIANFKKWRQMSEQEKQPFKDREAREPKRIAIDPEGNDEATSSRSP